MLGCQSICSALLFIWPFSGQIISKAIVRKCELNANEPKGGPSHRYADSLYVNIIVDGLPDAHCESLTLTKATGQNDTDENLSLPIEITIGRRPSSAQYRLRHITDLYGNPVEKYLITSSTECDKIMRRFDSNHGAFCCHCSFFSSLGVRNEILRNTTACRVGTFDAIVSYVDYQSDDIYHVYDISEPVVDHSIQLSIKIGEDNVLQDATVGTLRPRICHDDLSVSYHADFPLILPGPVLNSNFLVRSKNEDKQPHAFILEKNLFGLDGRECNKIGVRGAAFQNQPNRCHAAAGSCLHNQIADHMRRAEYRKAFNMTSKFYLTDFGNLTSVQTRPPSITYQLPSQRLVSLLTIEAKMHNDVLFNVSTLQNITINDMRSPAKCSEKFSSTHVEIKLQLRNLEDTSGSVHLFCEKGSTLMILPITVTLTSNEQKTLCLPAVLRPETEDDSRKPTCYMKAHNEIGHEIASRTFELEAHTQPDLILQTTKTNKILNILDKIRPNNLCSAACEASMLRRFFAHHIWRLASRCIVSSLIAISLVHIVYSYFQ